MKNQSMTSHVADHRDMEDQGMKDHVADHLDVENAVTGISHGIARSTCTQHKYHVQIVIRIYLIRAQCVRR